MCDYLLNLKNLISKHPKYEQSIIFDGESEPYFDINKLIKIHTEIIEKEVKEKIAQINEQIQVEQEKDNPKNISRLISFRKRVRELKNRDCSSWNLEEILNDDPVELHIDILSYQVV